MRLELVLHLCHVVRIGQGIPRRRDVRPTLGVLGVDLDPLSIRIIGVGDDGIDRALGLADAAIDALFRFDDQEVLALIEAIDGAHFDAVCVLARNARVGDDVSQTGSPLLRLRICWINRQGATAPGLPRRNQMCHLAPQPGRAMWFGILSPNGHLKPMTEALSTEKKQLLYRAMHRGFKEADIVVGRFAEAHLADMTDEETALFRQLLDVPDRELYAWIIGRETAPANYQSPLLERMQAFDVAATMPR